ncbi:dihydrofolate reductase [Aeromonas phage avDM3]|nr:dihydrofolate reductase [Aeromonas phage avDM3]
MIKAVFALGVPSDFHKHGVFAFGKDGDLPWPSIPEDFKLFREKTDGTICVMGAKTFQSLPKNLPGRVMVVIGDPKRECRNKSGELPDNFINIDIDWISVVKELYPENDISIIGGLGLILSVANKCDELHINFLMLTSDYDTIDPTVYITDTALGVFLGKRKMNTNAYRVDHEHCTTIKAGIWK